MKRFAPATGVMVLLLIGCTGPPPGEEPDQLAREQAGAAPVTSPDASHPSDATTGPVTPPAVSKEVFVPPVRGTAEIVYVKPAPKVENALVVTTFQVKNVSAGSIAGLKLEEYWWDKAGNPVTGSSARLKVRLNPGSVATLTLATPKVAGMYQCNYRFSHANGTIKAVATKSLE